MARPILFLSILLGLLSVSTADTLVTTDGRIVDGFPIERTETGASVRFTKGTVAVPTALIRALVIEEDERTTAEDRKTVGEAVLRRSWTNRHRLKTAHFVFEFTVPDSMMEPVASRLEAFASALYAEWGDNPVGTDRVRILVAATPLQAEQVFGMRQGLRGELQTEPAPELHLVLDYQDLSGSEKLLRSLITRHLLSRVAPRMSLTSFPAIPLEDYYAASREGGEAGAWSFGAADGGLVTWLHAEMRYGPGPSIHSILTEPSTRKSRPFAWSLVRYLLADDKLAPAFRSWVKWLGKTGRPVASSEGVGALLTAFGLDAPGDLNDITAKWRTTLTEKLGSADPDQALEAARASVRLNEFEAALVFYEAAVKGGRDGPTIYHEIGRLLLQDRDLTRAMAFLQKARTLDPLDPVVTGSLGRLLIRRRARNEGMRLLDLALEMSRVIR